MNLSDLGISAITFDLDDTLWPCDTVIRSAEKVFFEWLQSHCPSITEVHTIETLREKRRSLLVTRPELINDVTEWRRLSLIELLSEFQLDLALGEQALSVFVEARQRVEFFPDVIDALQDLSFHYRLGSLTNGNADLDTIGIAHLFDSTLYATLDLPAKPAADMFELAARELGVSTDKILHVGDNANTDIRGARDAGCKTAWINRYGHQYPSELPKADIEIVNLHELVALSPLLPGGASR